MYLYAVMGRMYTWNDADNGCMRTRGAIPCTHQLHAHKRCYSCYSLWCEWHVALLQDQAAHVMNNALNVNKLAHTMMCIVGKVFNNTGAMWGHVLDHVWAHQWDDKLQYWKLVVVLHMLVYLKTHVFHSIHYDSQSCFHIHLMTSLFSVQNMRSDMIHAPWNIIVLQLPHAGNLSCTIFT